MIVLADAGATVFSGSLLLALPIAVLAGLLSFASPCVLPLVPGYLGYLGGMAGAADARRARGPATVAPNSTAQTDVQADAAPTEERTSGRGRVAGALLPEAAGRARRRITYVDLATTDDAAAALEAAPTGSVVFVDSIEQADTPAARDAVDALIARTAEAGGAVVLCAADADHLSHFTIDGVYEAPALTHEGSRA